MAGKENISNMNTNVISSNSTTNTTTDQDDLGIFKVGDTLIAKWMDGEPRSCVVIDRSM